MKLSVSLKEAKKTSTVNISIANHNGLPCNCNGALRKKWNRMVPTFVSYCLLRTYKEFNFDLIIEIEFNQLCNLFTVKRMHIILQSMCIHFFVYK